MLDRALGDAERDAGDAEREEADRRKLIEHRRVDLAARVGAAGDLVDRERAVAGDEDILDRYVLAARPGEADDVPGVDDRVVARRQQEDARTALAALLVVDDAADEVPGGGIDAARKRPAAGEAIAALHLLRPAARENQRRADQIVGRLAPNLVLRP